jgi:hypothetical protein
MHDKGTRGINMSLRVTVPLHRRSNGWEKRTPSAIPRVRSTLLEQVPDFRAGGRAMPFGVAFRSAAQPAEGTARTGRY